MKSTVALLSVGLIVAAAEVRAQAPRGEAKLTLAGKKIAIDYGRPALKGRDMLGQLAAGQSWRLGADAETTLQTAGDLSFGTIVLPKGKYVLTAMRSAENKWSLVATGDKVVEIPLASETLKEPVELFTIELLGKGTSGQLVTKWQTLQLSAPFTAR